MFRNIALLSLLTLLSNSVYADIYQCHQLDGSLSFQDMPCETIELEEVIQLEAINAITALPPTSAGIETEESYESEFEKPIEAIANNTDLTTSSAEI